MKARVTPKGVLIPKRLLEGITEVEILKKDSLIVVVPLSSEDPILQLGKSPVVAPEDDAAENHDRYIYP